MPFGVYSNYLIYNDSWNMMKWIYRSFLVEIAKELIFIENRR
jgi:hypothetical protein